MIGPLLGRWYIHHLLGRWWLHKDVLHRKPLFKPWRPWA